MNRRKFLKGMIALPVLGVLGMMLPEVAEPSIEVTSKSKLAKWTENFTPPTEPYPGVVNGRLWFTGGVEEPQRVYISGGDNLIECMPRL